METKVVKAEDYEGLALAAKLLKEGEVVAIPTETVYGLAANGLDEKAVPKIFQIKGRPQDNPLILHIADLDMWKTLVSDLPDSALKLAEAFWPGPLTIILPKSDRIPTVTCAGLPSVGVRMPDHESTRELIRLSGVPLAAPSANLSGLPSPTMAEHCLRDLSGKIPLIMDGGSCPFGIESTIISLVDEPILLRPGAITKEQLEKVLGCPLAVSGAISKPLATDEAPLSPGMKYRHYSPKARVIIVEGDRESYLRFMKTTPEHAYGLIFEEDRSECPRPYICYGKEGDSLSQAHGLFAALRELDERGAELVYARCPSAEGVGMGVYNRILRAAGFEVIRG